MTLAVPNYVKRHTSPINVDFGLSKSTETYLKTRFNHLAHERDKYVSIIIDEVYAHASIEFVGGGGGGGKFFGLENGTPTKTLLCTVLKSIAGCYHDLVPLTSITTIRLDDL